MDLFTSFITYINSEKLFAATDKLLLAVSGGVDSVVLCELCYRAGFNFSIAHCNFQLRAEESERDEVFVKKLGEKYSVQVFIQRFDTTTYAKEKGISIQVAARELRYNWFYELLKKQHTGETANGKKNAAALQPLTTTVPFAFVATAHHCDDNVETVLMNFFKGTGIAGLRGILPKQAQLIRPLLFATKQQLVQFAQAHHLQWVEDSSNDTEKYSRNYFRRQVIPMVQSVYPAADTNIADNIARFRDIEILYRQAIAVHKNKLLIKAGNEIHIPVLKLKKSEPIDTILYEIAKEYGFTSAQVPEIKALLKSESGKYIASSGYRMIRNRAWLIIAPLSPEDSGHIIIDEPGSYAFAEGVLKISERDASGYSIVSDALVAALDCKSISFPLIVRKWKTGDYFYPLGMKKKKKLSRFFIDQKLSKTDKENIWVIESNKRIVWVVGQRIDDRFKVHQHTSKIFQIVLHKSAKP